MKQQINKQTEVITPETAPKPGGLSNLQLRFIAGISGAALVVWAIVFSDWTFALLFFAITILAQKEFYGLLKSTKKKPNTVFGLVIGAAIYCLVFAIHKGFIPVKFYLLLLPLCAFIFIYEMYNSKKKPFNNVAYTYLGIIYVAIPLALMVVIGFIHGTYNYQIVIGCLLLLWASDTGAYFSGKTLGRTPLFPRVSPKKTWEGSIGGALTSFGVSYGLSHYFPVLALHQWFTLSVIIVVFGSYGDLVESAFKRSLKIKDSGTLIPGHGGLLDRFDGLLLSTPFIVAYLLLF